MKELNLIFIVPILFVVVAVVVGLLILELQYRKTTYYRVSNRGLITSLIWDKGAYGEYLIYKNLLSYEHKGAKFLFNAYLPSNSKKIDTTEIDVIMIYEDGICVFESKNYSGWIFGNEHQKNWTQCLKGNGKKSVKEKFYNPVWQNKAHIDALKNTGIIGENIPIYSIIAFSDRCVLKKISVCSQNTFVINRSQTKKIIKQNVQPFGLKQQTIDVLYQSPLPYTQISDAKKMMHINQINSIR